MKKTVRVRGRSMTTWTRRGGRWSKKCLFLSTFRVKNVHVEIGGGQKGQNCVHVVIECPLDEWIAKICKKKFHDVFFLNPLELF